MGFLVVSILFIVPDPINTLGFASKEFLDTAFALSIKLLMLFLLTMLQQKLVSASQAKKEDRGSVSPLAIHNHYLYSVIDFAGMFFNIITGLFAFVRTPVYLEIVLSLCSN